MRIISEKLIVQLGQIKSDTEFSNFLQKWVRNSLDQLFIIYRHQPHIKKSLRDFFIQF